MSEPNWRTRFAESSPTARTRAGYLPINMTVLASSVFFPLRAFTGTILHETSVTGSGASARVCSLCALNRSGGIITIAASNNAQPLLERTEPRDCLPDHERMHIVRPSRGCEIGRAHV